MALRGQGVSARRVRSRGPHLAAAFIQDIIRFSPHTGEGSALSSIYGRELDVGKCPPPTGEQRYLPGTEYMKRATAGSFTLSLSMMAKPVSTRRGKLVTPAASA